MESRRNIGLVCVGWRRRDRILVGHHWMKLGLHRLGECIVAVSGMGRRNKVSGEGDAGGECPSEK